MALQSVNFGLTVPTTNVWDVNEIQQVDVNSPEFKELLIRLYQNLNLISTVLNLKDSAYYDTHEFVTGQSFFPNPTLNSTSTTVATYRPTYRLVVNFGALPNAGASPITQGLHGLNINSGFTFTRIYGAASDTTGFKYIPIPYASASGADDIQLDVNATNVVITTASNRSNFNVCYVVLEFMKF
jgi:hypothetical protein